MKCDNKKLSHAERARVIEEAERQYGRPLTEEEKSRLVHEAERAHRSCRAKDDNELFKYLMYALGLALAGLLGYYLFKSMSTRDTMRQAPAIAEQQRIQAEQAAAATATPVVTTTPATPVAPVATTPAQPAA